PLRYQLSASADGPWRERIQACQAIPPHRIAAAASGAATILRLAHSDTAAGVEEAPPRIAAIKWLVRAEGRAGSGSSARRMALSQAGSSSGVSERGGGTGTLARRM